MGYIVVPIFHNANKNIEAEIKKKPIFNHLVDVVRSLCDQDERLQAEIDEVAFKEGKKTSSKIDFRFTGESIEKIIKRQNFVFNLCGAGKFNRCGSGYKCSRNGVYSF